MKVLKKALLVGGLSLAVLVPVTAVAADSTPPVGGRGNGDCTTTQDTERLRLRDGTGWRHSADGTVIPNANGHRTGPMDGSGPRADRPLDGTGNQVRAGQ